MGLINEASEVQSNTPGKGKIRRFHGRGCFLYMRWDEARGRGKEEEIWASCRYRGVPLCDYEIHGGLLRSVDEPSPTNPGESLKLKIWELWARKFKEGVKPEWSGANDFISCAKNTVDGWRKSKRRLNEDEVKEGFIWVLSRSRAGFAPVKIWGRYPCEIPSNRSVRGNGRGRGRMDALVRCGRGHGLIVVEIKREGENAQKAMDQSRTYVETMTECRKNKRGNEFKAFLSTFGINGLRPGFEIHPGVCIAEADYPPEWDERRRGYVFLFKISDGREFEIVRTLPPKAGPAGASS